MIRETIVYISLQNLSGKTIINGRTSSIHSSDKMNQLGILMFNSCAFRFDPQKRAAYRPDRRRCTHQFYNGLLLCKRNVALAGKLSLREKILPWNASCRLTAADQVVEVEAYAIHMISEPPILTAWRF